MSEMPGQRQLLNICFSCLRYSRIFERGPPLIPNRGISNIFVRGNIECSCQYSTTSQSSSNDENKQQKDFKIESNPFYEKYRDKLKHLSDSDPEGYSDRMQQLLEERKRPAKHSSQQSSLALDRTTATPQPIPQSASYTKSKGLDSIMKLELVQDKSPAEIELIWKEYHSQKDCVYAVLKKEQFEDLMIKGKSCPTKEQFEDLMIKGKSCPTFVYPVPKNDGYEFTLMQFDGKDLQFTPLGMYQILRENAPACLSVVYYTELMESKGLVLMSGQYDDKVLKREDALLLVQMIAIYYGKDSPRFHKVHAFNHTPDKFDYNELIEEFKSMYTNLQQPSVTN